MFDQSDFSQSVFDFTKDTTYYSAHLCIFFPFYPETGTFLNTTSLKFSGIFVKTVHSPFAIFLVVIFFTGLRVCVVCLRISSIRLDVFLYGYLGGCVSTFVEPQPLQL